ncbi:MAG TPA: branched-chain amino acid ABC transporter permease [Acidocella sp.]|nr:branched-chain amino acid ABC transporter permease [Acidocella sp.]
MDAFIVTLVSIAFGIASLILLSLGLAVIFGMMRVINLAQGEFLTLGAYTVVIATKAGIGLWPAMAIAPVLVGMVGLLLERCVIRFLYGRILDTMLATWGLSLVIIGAINLVLGPTTQGIATPLGFVSLGRYSMSLYQLFVIAVALGAFGGTYLLFRHTKFGLLARATMQKPRMVAAAGVDPSLVYMGTFGFGAALAGLAGAVMAPMTGVVPTLGLTFIAKIFITVIVGGPLIFLGTACASSLLGTVETVISFLSSPIFGEVALLAVAIVVIRVLPEGISGLR